MARSGLPPLLLCAALLGAAGCGGQDRPLVILDIQGGPADGDALRVSAVLDGFPASAVKEVHERRFGLRLPAGAAGGLSLAVEALRQDRCVTGRGYQRRVLAQAPVQEVAIELRTLPAPICLCTESGWCWEQPLPQGNTLTGVWALARDDAWAVGELGTVLHYDGRAWTVQPSGTTAGLTAVWGRAAQNVWAVGEQGTILHWDGATWSALRNPFSQRDLYAVWGAGDDVWIGGDNGTLLRVVDGQTLISEDSGGRAAIRALCGPDPNNLWAAGEGGTLRQRTPRGWRELPGFQETRDLYALWCPDGAELWIGGQGGLILHLMDGIALSEDSGTALDIQGLYGGDRDEVWAVGGSPQGGPGVALRRHVSRWSEVPVQGGAPDALLAVYGSSDQDVWAVGRYGDILHWQDQAGLSGGRPGAGLDLQALWGSGPEDVWAAGGYDDPTAPAVALLHFDGRSWVPEAGVDQRPGWLSALDGAQDQGVWAVGRQGLVLHRAAGVPSWTVEDTGASTDLNAVRVTPDGEVWVAGDQGLVLHRAGGKWQQGPPAPGVSLRALWLAGPAGPLYAGGADAGQDGVLLRLQGAAWVAAGPGGLPAVRTIGGSGPGDVWVLAERGPLWHFDGARWQPFEGGGGHALDAIWASGPSAAWAVGAEGRILAWDGTAWSASQSGTANDLHAIWGPGPAALWTAGNGGTVLRQRL